MFSLKFAELLPEGTVLEFDSFYKRLNKFLQESFNDNGTLITEPPAQISDLGLPVATVIPFAGSTVPTGWLLCNGDAISRSTYSTLFTTIGTTYGSGNGSTTFNIPDLRQKFPLGKAASGTGSTLGGTGGAIDHTHTGPSHTHTGPSHTHTGPSHTHTGPSHTHTGPAHTHTGPAHTHDTVVPRDGWGSGSASAGRLLVSNGGILPTGSVAASADRTFTSTSAGTGATGSDGTGSTGASGTGATGADGTGATGAEGTGATGSAGAGTTGTSNPPFLAINYLILYA